MSSTPVEYLNKHTSSTITETSSNTRRFCIVKSDGDVELARKSGIPQKTKEDAKYCTSMGRLVFLQEERKWKFNSAASAIGQ